MFHSKPTTVGAIIIGTNMIAVATRRSLRPDVQLTMAVRAGVRELCRRSPGGWRTFRRLERFSIRAPPTTP